MLVQRIEGKVEGTEMSDIDAKLGFPTFQKYSSAFGVDLTGKTAKIERDALMMTVEETVKLFGESECKMIEEYVTELGENAHEF